MSGSDSGTPTAPRGSLILFSSTVPISSNGSFVIFRRHLLPLVQSGWTLTIASYFPPPEPADALFWRHLRLPFRRPWWPPADPRFLSLMRLRARLLLRHLERSRAFRSPVPTVLLTSLWDPQALLGAAAARSGHGRLGVFLHDDEILWNRESKPQRYLEWNRRQVLAAADRIWSVSARLIEQLDPADRPRAKVLRPLPGRRQLPFPAWQPRHASGVHLGYAGKVYPGLWPLLGGLARLLAKAGGRLTVITDPAGIEQAPAAAPIELRPYFPEPGQSARWLRENCSAVLVAHPLASDLPHDRWEILRTSFPSKLTEYAQLGLPLLLIGMEDSEFAAWARRDTAIPFFTSLHDPALQRHLDALQTEAGWNESARWTRQLASGPFDPDQLQQEFDRDIEALAHPS